MDNYRVVEDVKDEYRHVNTIRTVTYNSDGEITLYHEDSIVKVYDKVDFHLPDNRES